MSVAGAHVRLRGHEVSLVMCHLCVCRKEAGLQDKMDGKVGRWGWGERRGSVRCFSGLAKRALVVGGLVG